MLAAAIIFVSAPGWAGAQEPSSAGEELTDEDLDKLDAPGPGEKPRKAVTYRVPTEHDYDRRMLVLPALLVLMLAWNVNWK